jgi:LysM repeat protein
MQLTHQEARRLVQYDADRALKTEQKQILEAHLESCEECRGYAESIRKMESMLVPLLQRRWNVPHPPIPIVTIRSVKTSSLSERVVLATRIVAAGVMAIVFLFSVWLFPDSHPGSPATMPVNAAPLPTPSAQSTSTQVLFQNCERTVYLVQPDDTLERIAAQFSVPISEILAASQLQTDLLTPGMELVIPLCRAQPTGTIHVTETTFTPLTNPTQFTPSGQATSSY